ncbi:MAG TPA: hypothetical protein VHM16_02490 [Rubrobacteraceae bacterium]|nr:hypothetical protein [Rubrobacteraceae bacterium]
MNGFPLWYQDANGRRLDLCLDEGVDAGGLCLTGLNNPAAPPTIDNFADVEAFYWVGDAGIERRAGGLARLRLAAEAAFANDPAADGDQITFGRVRVRIDNLRPNTVYTITYPYGVMKLRSDGTGVINVTRDIGCAAVPCNFGVALRSPVFQSFLRWDPNVGRPAPAGHLGDPAIDHRVVGSPFDSNAARPGLQPANFFRIEGPGAGGRGTGIDRVQTNLFSIQGRLAN